MKQNGTQRYVRDSSVLTDTTHEPLGHRSLGTIFNPGQDGAVCLLYFYLKAIKAPGLIISDSLQLYGL